MLPKTIAYVKRYDGETEYIIFLIRDDNFMKKHNDVKNKVTNSIKK